MSRPTECCFCGNPVEIFIDRKPKGCFVTGDIIAWGQVILNPAGTRTKVNLYVCPQAACMEAFGRWLNMAKGGARDET